MISTFLAAIFFTLGFVSILVGVIGLYRFNDPYTRLHASSLIDTIGVILIFMGMIMLQDNAPSTFKIILMILMVFLFGPVSTHSIAKSIYICLGNKASDDRTHS